MWWWISFVDREQPKGEQFLGVCLVEAPDVKAALGQAWMHGCNPGGEAMSYGLEPVEHLPADHPDRVTFERFPKYTLLVRARLDELGYQKPTDGR